MSSPALTEVDPAPDPAPDRARTLAYTSYLRVLGIAGVVFIHIAGLSYVREDLRGTSAFWAGAVLDYGARWAVIVFVMVSGALLLAPPRNADAPTFYRRRMAKLGIPLLVWHVVYIALAVVSWKPRPTPQKLLANFLEGESYTALYFFWLILGLYAVTPLLWRLGQGMSDRALAVAGAGLAAVPAVDVVLRGLVALLREEPRVLPQPTLVTQFVPYVGFFVLGYALRNVVVRGGRLVALVLVLVALQAEMVLQAALSRPFSPDGDGLVNGLLSLDYQGLVVGASAVAVFVVVRSVVHPASPLAAPSPARRMRTLGDLTFGVFACHLLVFFVMARLPGVQLQRGAESGWGVVALSLAVLVASFAVSWLLSRTAYLRRAV